MLIGTSSEVTASTRAPSRIPRIFVEDLLLTAMINRHDPRTLKTPRELAEALRQLQGDQTGVAIEQSSFELCAGSAKDLAEHNVGRLSRNLKPESRERFAQRRRDLHTLVSGVNADLKGGSPKPWMPTPISNSTLGGWVDADNPRIPANYNQLLTFLRICGVETDCWPHWVKTLRRIRAQRKSESSHSTEGQGPPLHAREDELDKLSKLATAFKVDKNQSVICVTGVGGVGKTTLAEACGEALATKKLYSKSITIRLRAHAVGQESERAQPADALSQLHAALCIEDTVERSDDAAAATRFRNLAAQHDLLIILDDAFDAAQADQLLSDNNSYTTIITSRNPLLRLRDPERENFIELHRMSEPDAERFLLSALRRELHHDMDALKSILPHTVGLPLVLYNIACLVNNGVASLDSLATALEENSQKLRQDREDRLQLFDLDEEQKAPFAVFETSYRRLRENDQKVFRLLSLRLGQNIDKYAVSCVTGLGPISSQRSLQALVDVGLAERDGERFEIHDLHQDYAWRRLHADDSPAFITAAMNRMVTNIYGCVNHGFNVMNRDNVMVDHGFLNDWQLRDKELGTKAVDSSGGRHGSSWFSTERENIMHLIVEGCASEPPIEYAPELSFSVFYFLERGGHWNDWTTATRAGLKALDLNPNLALEAALRRNSARIELVHIRDWQDQVRHEPASENEILDLRTRCSDTIEQFEVAENLCLKSKSPETLLATIKREIADTYLQLAKIDEAPEALRLALDSYLAAERMFEQAGSSENPIASLKVSLSEVYRMMGSKYFEAAESCLDQALAYAFVVNADGSSELKHRYVWAYGLLRRSELRVAQSRLSCAIDSLDEAIAAFRLENDRPALARALVTRAKLRTERLDSGARATAHDDDLKEAYLALRLIGSQEAESVSRIQLRFDLRPPQQVD